MARWLRGALLAGVFALVGAFSASLWLELRRETPASAPVPITEWEGRTIRVEVLNGAGIPNIADETKERLRKMGFDVVYWGNVEGFGEDTSHVIARVSSVEPALRVANALSIRKITRDPEANLFLDASVILGTDWTGTAVTEPDESLEGAARWLDRVKRAAARLWPG